ncbi:MAG: ABC transporter permease subunit [Ignavibacteriae bacterium]|nr:ABC transporter permease subunit [Ignavibacteriota bacterium]
MNLTNIKYIFLKELRSYFNSAIAYIVIVGFLAILGWFFTTNLFLMNMSSLRVVFEITPFLLLFFGPLITMRLLSEEMKTGTLELLMTKPIREHEIVIGKFLSAWALFFFTLLPTISYYITVALLGRLDLGPVIGGYLGLMFVGGVFISVSMLGSSLSENQITSAIVSFIIVFGLFMLDKVLYVVPPYLASVLEYMSIDYHFSNIARGVIDTRDLIYYLSMISFSLMLGSFALQRKRW